MRAEPMVKSGKVKMRQVIVPIMIVVGMIAGVGGVYAIYALDTLVDYKDGSMSWVGAFGRIAGNYLQKYRLFVGGRSAATA